MVIALGIGWQPMVSPVIILSIFSVGGVKIPRALEITDGKFICRPMYPSDRTTQSFSKTQYLIRIIYRQWRGSAVKEPNTFEVRKSSSQVIRMHFFPQIKLTTFF